MGKWVAGAVVGALLFVVGTGAALAEEPVKACGARGDLTDLIACLRFAYGRSDAAAPQECERRPPAIVRPIEGRPVLRYGEQTSYGGLSKGLVVEGVPGALVSAPAAGFVLFAGEFRSYGTLVIIDAGCDTVVLLAGIAALTVAAGGQVDRDGPIGTMPTPPAADDLPVVYIEVRRNGAPVDPGLR